jgi:lipopolysaccharide transport system ATP-binding protein
VALCNSAGHPCSSFRQGDLAVFYYEFELAEDIGVPICGVVIKNDRGVIVHGKNSWQYENDVPASQGAGSRIRCRQEIKLDIAPGEYLFEIGLASVSLTTWTQRERVSHEEMSGRQTRICHIADVASFSVGLAIKNGIPALVHHGLANLPGAMRITVAENAVKFEQSFNKVSMTSPGKNPTVFHITHWKAGSQWLYKILREIALERIVPPQLGEKQFFEASLVRGGVYPTLYVTKEQFHSVLLPNDYRKFIVIRDLRDTLISGYFSIRYSHAVIDERLASWRKQLESMTTEDGLLMLMDEWLPMSARIQKSWLDTGETITRYEDLLEKDTEILEEILIGQCEIQVTPQRLREIVLANRFENMTGGRKPGEENVTAHERKGITVTGRITLHPASRRNFMAGLAVCCRGLAISKRVRDRIC